MFLVVLLALFGITSCDTVPDLSTVALTKHNEYRAKHGAPPMHWHKDAAEFAQKHCNYLAKTNTFTHSHDSSFGENLFGSIGGKPISKMAKAVDAWYKEYIDFDFKHPDTQTQTSSRATGHFTEVVWKSSTGLGCAESKSGIRTWVCCNYYPPGNFKGQYTDNVQPPQ